MSTKSKRKYERITGPDGTIRAGTKLPPEVAAMVTLGVIMSREGDDITGQYDNVSAAVMLQADGDDALLQRLEHAHALGLLDPAISAFVKALTEALGGEVVGRGPAPISGGRRVGRA
jgi:hypothetical protein